MFPSTVITLITATTATLAQLLIVLTMDIHKDNYMRLLIRCYIPQLCSTLIPKDYKAKILMFSFYSWEVARKYTITFVITGTSRTFLRCPYQANITPGEKNILTDTYT